jgi:hypothetical protein
VPQASRRVEHMGRVGFYARSFLPWDGRSPVSHPTCDVSFPPKENRQISERDDLGPPVVPGGQEIGLGSRNLRPRAEARPSGLAGGLSPLVSAKACHMVKRRVGV